MRSAPVVRLLLCLAAMVMLEPALAQTLRIGVITSGLPSGRPEPEPGETAERAGRQAGRGLGGVEVTVRHDYGSAQRALEEARLLVEEGVHALICCSSPAAAALLEPFAAAARVPVLSPSRPSSAAGTAGAGGAAPWLLSLPPDPLTVMRAIGRDAAELGGSVGLLSVDNAFGREALVALEAGLLEAGLHLSRAELFTPGAAAVTPEALLVAASQPAAVVAWVTGPELVRAVEALRARGFEGPVYVPSEAAAEISIRATELGPLLVPAWPAAPAPLPLGHPSRDAVEGYLRAAPGVRGLAAPEAAYVYDAVDLLLYAFEQALSYGLDPTRPEQMRQAVWDALASMPQRFGAAGAYSFDAGRASLSQSPGVRLLPLGRRLPGP